MFHRQGNAHWHGNTGVGTGPWAGADLEQGMYYGGGALTQKNPGSLSLTSDFVSLSLKVLTFRTRAVNSGGEYLLFILK